MKKHKCLPCKYSTDKISHLKYHFESKIHKKITKQVIVFTLHCDPCNIHTNNESNFQKHCKLLSHYLKCGIPIDDNMSKKIFCELCKVILRDVNSFRNHCSTEGHIENLKNYPDIDPIYKFIKSNEEEKQLRSTIPLISLPYYCDPCEFGPCKSKEDYDGHLETKKHKLNFNLPLVFTFNCDVCGIHSDCEYDYNEHFKLEKCIPEENEISLDNSIDKDNSIENELIRTKKYQCKKIGCIYESDIFECLQNHMNGKFHDKTSEEIKEMRKNTSIDNLKLGDKHELFVFDLYNEFIDTIFRNVKRIGHIGSNKFDIMVEYKDEIYMRGVQIKSIFRNEIRNSFELKIPSTYDRQTLIVGVNEKYQIYSLIFVYELEEEKVETISFNPTSIKKLKYENYFYTDIDKFKHDLILKTKESFIIKDIRDHMPPECVIEYDSVERIKIKCLEMKLLWEENSTNSNEIDYFINSKKIQHKSSNCMNGSSSYRFNLHRKNGKNKTKPYSILDDIDFFIFEIYNEEYKNNFFIIPMYDMIDNGYITTDMCDGVETMYIPTKDKWKNLDYHFTIKYLNRFDLLKD